MTAPHYQGNYQREARRVRNAANANPDTLCRRCGQPARPGDPWQAGHINDSQPGGPLAPEHRSCNTSAGARLGNQQRRTWTPAI